MILEQGHKFYNKKDFKKYCKGKNKKLIAYYEANGGYYVYWQKWHFTEQEKIDIMFFE